MVRLGDRLARISALIIAASFMSAVVTGADHFAQAKSPQKSSDAISCPLPNKGDPAVSCYAAMRVGGKLPHETGRSGHFRAFRDYIGADVLVLGEVHDNWVHHALRARMMTAFAKAKRGRTAVVMEHIRSDNAEILARYQAGIDRTKPDFWKEAAAALGPALDWAKSGWPAWSDFLPIAEAAFRAGLPIYAGDVPSAEIRDVARKGLAAVASRDRAKFGLDQPLAPPLLDALVAQLEASHCGLMPKAAFGTMADAQRLRDASLARAAIAAARKHGSSILLTGNGHARTDRGVPAYIRRLAPDLKVISIALVEASDDTASNPPIDLLPLAPDGTPAADGLVVTGRIARADPCEKMRERFKRQRK